MKKILVFTTLILLLFITRVNASVLTYDKYFQAYEEITNIFESNNSYFAITDNKLIKYNKDFEIEATKQLEDIHNAGIIEYNGNILLVANKNNFVTIYLLDTDLRVLNSTDTTILFYKPNLYYYNNNIYLILGENYILEDTNMYEIDKDLQVKTNSISSYGDKFKEIVKSDYYAYNNENIDEVIKATAYNTDYIVLAGTNFVRLLDKDGKGIKEVGSQYPIRDVIILNNKILVADRFQINVYDINLELEEKIYQDELDIEYLKKLDDKIILCRNGGPNSIIGIYDFNINIYTEESNLGTLEIVDSAKPNTKVTYKITPNSGYEIDNIVITDEYGNEVKTNGEYFIAPSSDVKVLVAYKEIVINPETIDLIAVIVVLSGLTLLIFVKLYKKFKWISN